MWYVQFDDEDIPNGPFTSDKEAAEWAQKFDIPFILIDKEV